MKGKIVKSGGGEGTSHVKRWPCMFQKHPGGHRDWNLVVQGCGVQDEAGVTGEVSSYL